MKRSMLFLGLLFFASVIIANNGSTTRLIHSDNTSATIEFIPGSYTLNSVSTPQGIANTISIDKGSRLLIKGEPDLEKLTASLIIPDKAEMEVNVVSSNYYDVPNINIAPSKGNLYRNINPSDVAYTYGESYFKNGFFPAVIASLNIPYILRDFRGQSIHVCPFQYNPQEKTLRVYTSIIITVSVKNNNSGINQLNRTADNNALIDNEFEAIYSKQFLNYSEFKNTRSVMYTPVTENGSMLVICYDTFATAIQPFVTWKNQKGIATELVLKSVAGSSSTEIKSYITTYKNSHPTLKYVLLVGDAAQLPASSTGSGDSDNDYVYLTGNDSYPDAFIGRFSATSTSEVQTMVNRTLNYEKLPQANGTWYKNGIAIGSGQGPGDNNEYDWEHERNIAGKLLAYTYTSETECYDGSRGGTDASGNPSPSTIATAVNNGAGIVTYTGHGTNFTFVTSGFSVSDVLSLTNTNMYPFIWSVACVEGNFVANTTCFAEAWLRAGTPQQPKGALAALMSTINQSWDPPMKGQDAMVDILVESSSANIKRTFGGLSMNGCMQMNDDYTTQGAAMTDTWTIFGDPSVMVFTNTPAPMAVSHISTTPVGTLSIAVNCNVAGASICLSRNGVILGTGISNGINAVITISAATTGTIDVTATAFNKIPYLGTITVGGSVDIAANTIDAQFSVYPVPANNTLNITGTLTKPGKINIALFNVLGQEIMIIAHEETISDTFNKTIDIANLPAGVYFCKCEQGSFVTTKRVIVQK